MAGMPRVIPDAVRRAIAADARKTIGTFEGSTRKIAKRHGVSESTVRRIVAEDTTIPGFGDPATRARMQNAIDTTKQTLAERRQRLSEALIREAERAIEDANAPSSRVFNFGGKDNTFEMREVPFVPTKDRQILTTIAAICLDKHKMLDQYDNDAARGNAVDMWLAHMMGDGRPDGAV